jgi:hypothetical protein
VELAETAELSELPMATAKPAGLSYCQWGRDANPNGKPYSQAGQRPRQIFPPNAARHQGPGRTEPPKNKCHEKLACERGASDHLPVPGPASAVNHNKKSVVELIKNEPNCKAIPGLPKAVGLPDVTSTLARLLYLSKLRTDH